ncbi:MBL fold metallo-hydrolase [Brevibacillus sp. B_LB10_24]|uniref:MBL fold metallo-hydrolase n=1 Tax=Brevibacillus sp. B_LB10_24 TaxID=3380645 RepID=UPI0038B9A4E2
MEIQRISDTLFRIPVPVPFPMKYVYCYLFRGDQGSVVVDAGFNYPEAQEAWKAAFRQLDVHTRDVKAIYLTHFHPDHLGLAGWMQELTGAPVYLSDIDREMALRTWGTDSSQTRLVAQMCVKHGVPSELAEKIAESMEKLSQHVLPLAQLQAAPITQADLAGEAWQMIHTPGHSDGHVCFYQPERKWLLAGDHLLDKITPNISLWPGCSPNPLQDYLESLRQLRSLDVSLALPGHGKVITDVKQRIEEILQHHTVRLDRMLQLAKAGRTAYQVAEAVFSEKQLTPHQWRFALAETLAHLEYLASLDELAKVEGEQTLFQARQ